jgi:hypothetical protein
MFTAAVPAGASAGEALRLVESLLGWLAGEDAAGLPAQVAAERLRALEPGRRGRGGAAGPLPAGAAPRTGRWPAGSAPHGPGW